MNMILCNSLLILFAHLFAHIYCLYQPLDSGDWTVFNDNKSKQDNFIFVFNIKRIKSAIRLIYIANLFNIINLSSFHKIS